MCILHSLCTLMQFSNQPICEVTHGTLAGALWWTQVVLLQFISQLFILKQVIQTDPISGYWKVNDLSFVWMKSKAVVC